MRCDKVCTTEASIGADPPDLSVSDVTDQVGSLLAQTTSFAMMSTKAEGTSFGPSKMEASYFSGWSGIHMTRG